MGGQRSRDCMRVGEGKGMGGQRSRDCLRGGGGEGNGRSKVKGLYEGAAGTCITSFLSSSTFLCVSSWSFLDSVFRGMFMFTRNFLLHKQQINSR